MILTTVDRWLLDKIKEERRKNLKEVIEMGILTFDNIIEAQDITETTVSVPEWGGEVVVRSLSYKRMGKIKKKIADARGVLEIAEDDSEFEQELLVAGLVEPEVNADQAEQLMDKSANAVMTVLTAILGTSKETKDSVTEEEKSLPDES